MKMKLMWSLLVSTACLCSATNLAAKADAVDDGYYTSKDKEFYLTPEEILFIRPGLEIEILDVVIPADMQPEITYTISDPGGMPLDHAGVNTPGTVDMRFTLANIPMGEEQKVRHAYERISRNGTLTQLAPGKYHYKMEVVLASDQDTTHTLVLGGRRDLRDYNLDRYAANDLQNWVPSGMYDAVPRDVTATETCNRCHDPIAEHGSRWLSVAACGQCHNPSILGRGDVPAPKASLDVMIHRVHQELHGYPAELNDCEVCHTGGTPTEAFPMVANPNPTTVCDMTNLGTTELSWNFPTTTNIVVVSENGALLGRTVGEGSKETNKWITDGISFFAIDPDSGDTIQELIVNNSVLGCADNEPGTFRGEAGVQHTNWMDHPSRLVCGACHEDVDFETGEGHSAFNIAQPDDTQCQHCHIADSGNEFDMSVAGAHQVVYKSAQLPGLLVEILSVTNTKPGDTPTVTFSMSSKGGAVLPADMDFFRLVMAGPNDDFSFLAEEFASGAVMDGANWSYTFSTPLPADATGSFTVGAEVFDMVPITMGGVESLVRHTAENSAFAFPVTDEAAVERRVLVDDYKCENCHSNLALHGTIRHEPQYCVTCHLPAATDIGEVQEGNMEQSIHFKYMVHKIHRGEDLENGYVVAGHNQSIHDYSHVEYPGDLRNCDACHENDSQQLPLPAGLLPTTTPQEWWNPMMPVASACLSCHDDDDSAAHAYSNTTFFGESCNTCHGEGKSAAVDKVHAR